MSVFDFDGDVNGEYVEQLRVDEYAYYVTPLRPSSDNEVTSTVLVNEAEGIFTSTAAGTPADNPSDPSMLSDVAASRAVQIFFRPRDGFMDATFSVLSSSSAPTVSRLSSTTKGSSKMFLAGTAR